MQNLINQDQSQDHPLMLYQYQNLRRLSQVGLWFDLCLMNHCCEISASVIYICWITCHITNYMVLNPLLCAYFASFQLLAQVVLFVFVNLKWWWYDLVERGEFSVFPGVLQIDEKSKCSAIIQMNIFWHFFRDPFASTGSAYHSLNIIA